jgi:hypothetical protein
MKIHHTKRNQKNEKDAFISYMSKRALKENVNGSQKLKNASGGSHDDKIDNDLIRIGLPRPQAISTTIIIIVRVRVHITIRSRSGARVHIRVGIGVNPRISPIPIPTGPFIMIMISPLTQLFPCCCPHPYQSIINPKIPRDRSALDVMAAWRRSDKHVHIFFFNFANASNARWANTDVNATAVEAVVVIEVVIVEVMVMVMMSRAAHLM